MQKWTIRRIATLDDDTLCRFIEETEKEYGKVVHIEFIGDNEQKIRIYQIFYVQEA